MELPSIKLNIFKKLEYFLVLKKLNQQFDAQFNLYIDAQSKHNKLSKEVKTNTHEPVAPTWEVEKKILFWTYAYHKHLKSPLRCDHFETNSGVSKLNDIFITEVEIKKAGFNEAKSVCVLRQKEQNHTSKEGIDQFRKEVSETKHFLKNLEQKEFCKKIADCQWIITSEGLAFGELIWYLYTPVKRNKTHFYHRKEEKYILNYNAEYVLSRKSWSYFFLQLQLISIYFFTVFATLYLVVQLLDLLQLKQLAGLWFFNLSLWGWQPFQSEYIWMWFAVPFVFFIIGFVGALLYDWIFMGRKLKKVESLKNEK